MENNELRTTLTLKRQKSNILLTSVPKTNFTSPAIQQFQSMADKYKLYLASLNQKIDSVCQKEQYRNYLKHQKLNSVKNKLMESKNQLQKVLQDKQDPIKSPNGKIYAEILELQKLEASYNDILQKIQKDLQQKKHEIEELTLKVKQQKKDIKKSLRESFCQSLSNSSLNLSRITKKSNKKSLQSKSGFDNYKSRSRVSMLSRLESSWEQKTKQMIHEQEEKGIMLRLFCVFARTQKAGSHGISSTTLELVEEQLRQREQWLSEAKQILKKQDKRSLHGD